MAHPGVVKIGRCFPPEPGHFCTLICSDAFRRKEIPQEIAEALGGWAESEGRKKKAVSNNYGSGFTLEQRKKYLDMLEFPYF